MAASEGQKRNLMLRAVLVYKQGSQTGDRYMQVNLTVNIRDDFLEVVQRPLYTG